MTNKSAKMDFATTQHQLRRFIGWFYLANTLFFWLLGLTYLLKILSSDSLFQNLASDYSSPGGRLLILFFAMTNYFTYMMLLACIPAVLMLLVTYVIPRKRWIIFLSILFATMSLTLLLIDCYIFSRFNFHLNTTILSMLLDMHMRNILGFSSHEMIMVFVILGLLIFLECVAAWVVWSQIVLQQRCQVEKKIARIWFAGTLICYFTLMTSLTKHLNILVQQTPNLPLFSQLLAYVTPIDDAKLKLNQAGEEHFSQRQFSSETMRYPLHAMQCKQPDQPLNVMVIMADTLRFDALQPAYMPHVVRFAQKSWWFMKHVSGGNATQPGLFSLFYSIPGNYWTAALQQKVSPVFMALLRQFGYASQVFWSSEMDNPPFDKTIYVDFNRQTLHHSLQSSVGSRDRDVTQHAIDFLTHHPKNRPFFLNLFYDATHSYCSEQDYDNVYNPEHKECNRLFLGKHEDSRATFVHRYQNALQFVDVEIQKVLDAIEKQGYLNNSIIIITSDHGEEFNDNDHNYWGHAGNFSAVQTHIPLLIHWPGESPRRIDYATTSYDVMPTLLQHLFSCQNPVSDYSIGQDILLEKGRRPFTLAGSYSNMGLIEPDRLTTLYASGDIVMTDPQLKPCPHVKLRMKHLKQAMALMRMYYAKSNSGAG